MVKITYEIGDCLEIMKEYPDLEKEDIEEALNYVAHLAEDRLMEIRAY